MLEVGDLRLSRHQLQPFWDSPMRFMVEVAAVPGAKAPLVRPKGNEPDFFGSVEGADYFHAQVTGGVIHKVRAVAKGCLHFGDHAVGDYEFAHSYEPGGGRLRDIGSAIDGVTNGAELC